MRGSKQLYVAYLRDDEELPIAVCSTYQELAAVTGYAEASLRTSRVSYRAERTSNILVKRVDLTDEEYRELGGETLAFKHDGKGYERQAQERGLTFGEDAELCDGISAAFALLRDLELIPKTYVMATEKKINTFLIRRVKAANGKLGCVERSKGKRHENKGVYKRFDNEEP